MNRRTFFLLVRTGGGVVVGSILAYHTGDLWWIPLGAVIGAFSQFLGYGFGGYFRR